MVWCKFVEVKNFGMGGKQGLGVMEIEIYNQDDENIAKDCECSQSSVAPNLYGGPAYEPGFVVNGFTNEDGNNKTATNAEPENWIRVHLAEPSDVRRVVVYGPSCPKGQTTVECLRNAQLNLYDDFMTSHQHPVMYLQAEPKQEIIIEEDTPEIWAKYVQLQNRPGAPLSIKEVEAFHPEGHNLLKDMHAEQSTTDGDYKPTFVCNGWTNDDPANGTLTEGGDVETITIHMEAPSPIKSVMVWNRFDESGECYKWLEGAKIRLLDDFMNPRSDWQLLSGEYKQVVRFSQLPSNEARPE